MVLDRLPPPPPAAASIRTAPTHTPSFETLTQRGLIASIHDPNRTRTPTMTSSALQSLVNEVPFGPPSARDTNLVTSQYPLAPIRRHRWPAPQLLSWVQVSGRHSAVRHVLGVVDVVQATNGTETMVKAESERPFTRLWRFSPA
jgi:hypothetical protein